MNKTDNNDVPVFKCDIRITDNGIQYKGELDGATLYSLHKIGFDEKVFDQIKSIMGKAMREASSLLIKEIQNMIEEEMLNEHQNQ